MAIRRAAFAATTGLAAVALLASAPAGAQEGLLPIEVTPTSGPAGTVVTVSGEGCLTDGGPGVVGVFLFFGDDDEPVLAFGTLPEEVAEDGSWSTGFIPEDTDPPGVYDVTATCFVDEESEEVLADYDFAPFELTAPPTTAPPTTTTTVPVTPQAPPAVPVVADPTFTG